jgi:L-lactate dehydrogenase
VHGLPHDRVALDVIFGEARDAAYRIIERKGATNYAVAIGLLRIVEAILRDQNTVLSVSSLIEGRYGISDICLSLPTVVNRRGVERVLHLELNPEELAGLRRSAGVLRKAIDSLGLEGQ